MVSLAVCETRQRLVAVLCDWYVTGVRPQRLVIAAELVSAFDALQELGVPVRETAEMRPQARGHYRSRIRKWDSRRPGTWDSRTRGKLARRKWKFPGRRPNSLTLKMEYGGSTEKSSVGASSVEESAHVPNRGN